MKIKFQTVMLATVLVLMVTGIASAGILGPANGTVPFGFSGVSDNSPGALSPTTSFTVPSVNVNGDGTGTFDSCPGPDPNMSCTGFGATLLTGTFQGNNVIGQLLVWDGGSQAGQYGFLVTSQNAPIITSGGPGITFYNIGTNGVFMDARGAAGYDTAAGSLGITFTETCVTGTTVNCSISGGATFATPPAFLTGPEPGTFIALGSGLIGLVTLVRRRRKA